MNNSRPGILAVRAVNQYRRHDVLTYLGLRYYLNNVATRTDQWARQVAPDIVMTRTDSPYFNALHFKESTPDGKVEHRQIILPSANEALAEAALLEECNHYPQLFNNPDCVFSYELSSGHDRGGIFKPYFGGLKKRHQAIAEACDANQNGVVRYTDIKRFYPSINVDLALDAWRRMADAGNIHVRYRELGEKLIDEHGKFENKKSILTGPMFSHFLGNLILRKLDEECSTSLPAQYFRYVDDITLVGDAGAVAHSLSLIRDRLAQLGLNLHEDSSPKSIEVLTEEWLKGRNDFHDVRPKISWATLIGDLKTFLLCNLKKRGNLCEAFRNEGFRIPVHDYTGAVYEASYLERLSDLARQSWFRKKSQAVTIQTLIGQAKYLQKTYKVEFQNLLDGVGELDSFNRKRRVPKLRYFAGRMIYLAADETLALLSPIASELPELNFHAVVMDAVASGNIDRLLSLGTNAAQAAAQPMKAANKQATTTLLQFSEAEEQALAVFFLNGVTVKRDEKKPVLSSELMSFATSGADIDLMKSNQSFMREIACLHGLGQPRHAEILETVFDKDESLAMDAIEQLQQSTSL